MDHQRAYKEKTRKFNDAIMPYLLLDEEKKLFFLVEVFQRFTTVKIGLISAKGMNESKHRHMLGCSINGHFRAKNTENQAQIAMVYSKNGSMGINMQCCVLY